MLLLVRPLRKRISDTRGNHRTSPIPVPNELLPGKIRSVGVNVGIEGLWCLATHHGAVSYLYRFDDMKQCLGSMGCEKEVGPCFRRVVEIERQING